jgi:hypothetical protein
MMKVRVSVAQGRIALCDPLVGRRETGLREKREKVTSASVPHRRTGGQVLLLGGGLVRKARQPGTAIGLGGHFERQVAEESGALDFFAAALMGAGDAH